MAKKANFGHKCVTSFKRHFYPKTSVLASFGESFLPSMITVPPIPLHLFPLCRTLNSLFLEFQIRQRQCSPDLFHHRLYYFLTIEQHREYRHMFSSLSPAAAVLRTVTISVSDACTHCTTRATKLPMFLFDFLYRSASWNPFCSISKSLVYPSVPSNCSPTFSETISFCRAHQAI